MRNPPVGEGVFEPRRSAQETKADTTSRIARQMIDDEAARREAKTAKLREARLAREEEEEALEAAGNDAKKPAGKRVTKAAKAAG